MAQRHQDSTDAVNGCLNHDKEGHQGDHLDLLHIVGGTRDQGRGAEVMHVLSGEGLHMSEEPVTCPGTQTHRSTGAEIDGKRSGDHLDESYPHHDCAEFPDQVSVTLCDAFIDDAGVEVRQIQCGYGCDYLQHDNADHFKKACTQIAPNKTKKHAFSIPSKCVTFSRTHTW